MDMSIDRGVILSQEELSTLAELLDGADQYLSDGFMELSILHKRKVLLESSFCNVIDKSISDTNSNHLHPGERRYDD